MNTDENKECGFFRNCVKADDLASGWFLELSLSVFIRVHPWLRSGLVALADHFEQHDAGGDGHVESAHRAGRGNRDDEITAFAHERVQSLALAAEDNSHGHRKIR